MNYATRIDRLQAQLPQLGCEALALTHLTNIRYLTGFSGTAGLLLVTTQTATFLTDFRYRSQAAAQVGDLANVVIASGGLWKEAAKLIKKVGASRVGIESEHLAVSEWEDLKSLLAHAEVVSTRRAVEDLRLIKDPDELELLREAVRIADEAFAAAARALAPGVSELEIAALIESQIRALGGSGTSFDTIVASGVRGALPHGIASEKIIERGEMVTIDMGARYRGYCSDMTRTLCVGPAADWQKEIYALTLQAQVTAAAALRPGLHCRAADRMAREVIDGAGHKDHFGHGLGHGVGLDIHEPPRLSQLGKGKLMAGMIVTCEPGIYLPDRGGVRIEDMLLITPEGAEILTGAPKPQELLEV